MPLENIKEKKQELRKIVKQEILALSKDYCQRADEEICKKVINLPEYQDAKSVFSFVGAKIEVNTKPLLIDVLAKGKKLLVPKWISRGYMEAYEIRSLEELRPGKYGILEPYSSWSIVEPKEIELCIIPCLACSVKGRRLGYGGGYYDRFLKRGDFMKVVLCRSRLLREDIPVGRYDVLMDKVVSEG